jgi:hypothetical protein
VPDTGLPGSLHAPDAHTALAVVRVAKGGAALPSVWLHQLELRNALRLRVFQREISGARKEASLNLFLADLAAGLWGSAEVEISGVSSEAERLGASCSGGAGRA